LTHLIRRTFFRRLLSAAFLVVSGVGLLCAEAEAAPLINAIPGAALPDVPFVTVRTTCWWQNGRRICHRRPVRQVCWWSRGRRVCTWR
jgi:hypothetical protein